MRRPPAVWLVDLERRDRDRASRPRQVHPELAQERIRADRRLLDRDEALHVRPGPVEERALGQELAGRVAAEMPRVAGEIEDLLLAAEDDLGLLDGAPVALEAVVDPRADEPRAELGEGPVERGALADPRGAMLEDDLAPPEVLDRGHGEAGGWPPEDP